MSGLLFVRNHDAETDALLKTDSAVSNASLKISSDSVFGELYRATLALRSDFFDKSNDAPSKDELLDACNAHAYAFLLALKNLKELTEPVTDRNFFHNMSFEEFKSCVDGLLSSSPDSVLIITIGQAFPPDDIESSASQTWVSVSSLSLKDIDEEDLYDACRDIAYDLGEDVTYELENEYLKSE
ncbi:MAG: hypothetical protein CMF12_14005 [Idiomarina sp.]|uniref:hypothetical protein n=1 Tax=Idiomarina sp. TaxID=1874361 RepID=UPI000C5C643D|nr:hypothetical protein [Idiomarina sp.]MBT43620.1 hypothetical protein [Idiomarina sp.]